MAPGGCDVTEESADEKFSRVSVLCESFQKIANAAGLEYKTSGPIVDGFQLRRHRTVWAIVYLDDQKPLMECSIQLKRIFLKLSGRFFSKYIEYAEEWAKNIDADIAAGEEALEILAKLEGWTA